MPATSVLIFADDEGSPFLHWVDSLPAKLQNKCIVRIEWLEQAGAELAAIESTPVADGILRLPLRADGTEYAILYFFYHDKAIILHGCTSDTAVPAADLAMALDRKTRFCACPGPHTYEEEKQYVPIKS